MVEELQRARDAWQAQAERLAMAPTYRGAGAGRDARRARGAPLMAPLVVRLAGGGLKREPSVALAFILRFCTIPFGHLKH